MSAALRFTYDPTVVMAGALCLRETAPCEPCIRPWNHDGQCDPDGLDGAQQRHPAGSAHHCRCGHGASTHTGGHGMCHQMPCACERYVDPTQLGGRP